MRRFAQIVLRRRDIFRKEEKEKRRVKKYGSFAVENVEMEKNYSFE